MNKQLIKAVSEQCGYEADDAELIQLLSDVSNNGAGGGFSGFIYHSDTRKFARDNMPLIIEQLIEDASNCGMDVFEIVSHFNCLNENYPAFEIASVIFGQADEATINDGADTQILNALAWYALEEVARYVGEVVVLQNGIIKKNGVCVI
tara:strand:- start:15 stop:461 length:447 start_codon:yes stop_codon:yes gene_type:complete